MQAKSADLRQFFAMERRWAPGTNPAAHQRGADRPAYVGGSARCVASFALVGILVPLSLEGAPGAACFPTFASCVAGSENARRT